LWASCRRAGTLEVSIRASGSSGCDAESAASVVVEGEAVDHEGVAEEVHELAGVADAVGASDPEGVFEVAVDRFRVVTPRVEAREVRV